MLSRFLYFGYYLKNLDLEKFRIFINHARKVTGKSSALLSLDVVGSSLKYNISILEYFQFHFFKLDEDVRKEYAGTGTMYEYQKVMNPKSSRHVLENKIEFHRKYSEFIRHLAIDINDLRNEGDLKNQLLNNNSGKIVLKNSLGQCGWQVGFYNSADFKENDLVRVMEQNNYDLAEEFLVQHPDLMALSPSGVNTVRIVTQLTRNNEVEILGARLRISENSKVDNMAAGNFAAEINEKSGIVIGPGVYGDITRNDVDYHPVTGVAIRGFQVPYWNAIIDMVTKAALLETANRSIGWDVVVTENGPGLIEGNHDWCKLVWQMPVKKGLKKTLDHHLQEYLN